MNPTDLMTQREAQTLPARRAAAIAWMQRKWIYHPEHYGKGLRFASTKEMFRPLWQRTRGVGDRALGLNDLRQRLRMEAYYTRANENYFTTDRSAVK